jgi:hypothetical protein
VGGQGQPLGRQGNKGWSDLRISLESQAKPDCWVSEVVRGILGFVLNLTGSFRALCTVCSGLFCS